MKKFLRVIFNIIRGVVRVVSFFAFIVVLNLIRLITYEPWAKSSLTKRKIRRIRFLTKVKLFVFNKVPDSVVDFFGVGIYKNYLNKHLGDGVQLCYEQTDRRAV